VASLFGVDFIAQESGICFLSCRFGLFDRIRQLFGIIMFMVLDCFGTLFAPEIGKIEGKEGARDHAEREEPKRARTCE
jgi:hypothetical protein